MPLSPAQLKALPLVRAGASNGEAAKAAGVRPETVGRWKTENRAFKDALLASRDAEIDDGDANVTHLKWLAYDRLKALLDDDDAGVALKAAVDVFKLFGTALPRYPGAPADDHPTESVKSV